MAKLGLELDFIMNISHIEINAIVHSRIKGRPEQHEYSIWICNLSKEQFEEMIELLYNEKHKENGNTKKTSELDN